MKHRAMLLCALLAVFAMTNQATAQKSRTVRAMNATQLIQAIAPDTIIELSAGDYTLPQLTYDSRTGMYPLIKDGAYVEYVEHYKIKNVRNLTIVGKGATPSHIVFKNTLSPVIEFEKCSSVTLVNIRAGHVPAGSAYQGCGSTTSPVFRFTDSSGISIKNCKMYGSGNWGIEGYKANNLTCANSEIYGCNLGIMSLYACSNVTFESCRMYNNTTGTFWFSSFILLGDVEKVVFNNCTFSNNVVLAEKKSKFYYDAAAAGFLVTKEAYSNAAATAPVTMNNCTITGNALAGIVMDPAQLKINGGKIINNRTVRVPVRQDGN